LGKEFTVSGFSSGFPGNRSTPTVVDNLVYTSSGTGTIACMDAQNGKIIWSKNIINTFDGILNEFGYSESLLTDGDKLFCYPGGKNSNIVALNRFTGNLIWASKAIEDTISHCSPMIIKMPKRNILITFSAKSLIALDAQSGELIWSQKQDSVKYNLQGNTPVYNNGSLYYVAGDGNGAVKLELADDGSIIKEDWRNPAFKNNISGFVLIDNYLYGSSENKKMLSFNASTGEMTDSVRFSSGSTIFADGKLYCYSDKNELGMFTIDKGKIKLVSRFKCEKGTKEAIAHPVISDGILYVRHGKALMAYKIK
jgi:outer membrane protein assembly factor BamB